MAYTNYILWGDDVPGAMGVHEAGAHQSCSLDDEFPALRKTVRGYLTPRLLLALGADYYADVFQPLDADLTAIAAQTGTGIETRIGADTWALRTLQGTANQVSIVNPAGIAGDPAFSLNDNIVIAQTGVSDVSLTMRSENNANILLERYAAAGGPGNFIGRRALGTVASPGAVTANTNMAAFRGDGWDGDSFETGGIVRIQANETFSNTARGAYVSIETCANGATTLVERFRVDYTGVTLSTPLTVPNGGSGVATLTGIVKGNGTGPFSAAVAGTDYMAGDPTLVALAAYNTNGLLTQTAADTFTGRTLQAPAAGFTITNPAGIAGDPTFVLANDLAALEGLGSTGIAVRSAANTWVQRAIAAGTGISVTNGDGVSGNPSVALDTSYTNGLYLALAGGTMTGTLTTRTSTTGAGTEAIVIPVGGKPASTVTGALYNDGSLHYTKAAGSISVGGAIFDYSTNATTGTTETDMFAPSIPANMLAANGDKLEFVFSGTITGHASRTREIRMYWGSNVLIDNGATVYASDADWTARGSLIRASSTTARVEITFFVNGVLPVMDYVALATLDFTTANTLKITGQSGAGSGASDITGRMGWVKFIPAAAL